MPDALLFPLDAFRDRPFVLAAALVAIQIGAIWAVFRAIRESRTPQGAVGWVVFLLAAPYVALPVFLFLGRRRLNGYPAAKRAIRPAIAALAAPAPPLAEAVPCPEGFRLAQGFARLAGVPVTQGNGVELLVDGDSTFAAIFAAIEAARAYVLVQTYILRDDELGRALQRRLALKAREGCRVRVLYDGIGSHALPRRALRALREAGVAIEDFHSIRKARSRFQINFRNHRKLVVVDGGVGFLGGHNFGDEYAGRDPRMGRWRDTHLRVTGPMVAQLQAVFAEDWAWATEATLDLDWQPPREDGGCAGLILSPGPADLLETGSLYFCNAIGLARERVWIASPYFVPDTDVLSALTLAAQRGVDVRILMAGKADHRVVWLAAFAHFDRMLDAGVKIYRYREGFMHQKVLVVDEGLGSVGTLNLDNRSCRLNFEVTALIFDRTFAARLAAMLEADFAQSDLVRTRLDDIRSPFIRHGARIARLMAPLL